VNVARAAVLERTKVSKGATSRRKVEQKSPDDELVTGVIGLPPGWLAVWKTIASGKDAGEKHIRFYGPNGRHTNVKTVSAAVRMDAIDRGLDVSQALKALAAQYAGAKLGKKAEQAAAVAAGFNSGAGRSRGGAARSGAEGGAAPLLPLQQEEEPPAPDEVPARKLPPSGSSAGKAYLRFYGPDGQRRSTKALFDETQRDAAARGLDASQALGTLRAAMDKAKAEPRA